MHEFPIFWPLGVEASGILHASNDADLHVDPLYPDHFYSIPAFLSTNLVGSCFLITHMSKNKSRCR